MTVIHISLRTSDGLSVPISWHSNPHVVCIGTDTRGSFEPSGAVSGAVSYTTVPVGVLMEEDEFDAQMDAFTGEEHDWRYFIPSGCTTAANAVSVLCHESTYYEMSLTAAASMFARATTPPAMDTIARNASVAATGVKVFYEDDTPYHSQSCSGDRLRSRAIDESYDDGSTVVRYFRDEEESEVEGIDYP
jgi:hypothetical protein